MDLDDSFTESLLQRSRARKEYLKEKKTGIISISKKRAALTDEQQINSGSPDVQPEESPKRQCTEASQSVYTPYDKENIQMQDEDPNAAFVPLISTSKTKGLAALKKNFMLDDEEMECEAKSNSQETPTTARFPAKSPIKSSQVVQQDLNIAKDSHLTREDSSDDEIIDENDFAENYNEIGSEHGKDKLELDYSPVKPLRNQETICVPTKTEVKLNIAKNPSQIQNIMPAPVQEFAHTSIDPAELPLSARKALFEKALLGGTPKLNEEVIDHKLSVAQRTAMFENASKSKSRPKKFSDFREPKRIAIPNFEKFESNVSNYPLNKSPIKNVQVVSARSPIKTTQQNSTKSPVKLSQQNQPCPTNSPVKAFHLVSKNSPSKIVQSVSKTSPQEIAGSPTKKLVSTPVTSTPSPTKNIGSHTRLMQQKLLESSGSSLQTKEISAKVVQERKQEISSLVKNWEKLSSSSSVDDNIEVGHNINSEHVLSEPGPDVVHASNYNEESNSEDEISNEYDEEDEHKVEKGKNGSDEESDAGESVFDSQDSEIASLMSLESNCSNEPNVWPREDTQSLSSRNAQSAMSTQSHSCVSSYSDDSSYNASRSQSCTSDSSARSYDVTNSNTSERAPSSSKENNPDVPLLYTVSFYRKQKQETRLTPVRTIVRRENVVSSDSPDDDYTEVIQKRLKALQEEILRQQTVISQTSQALNLCSATAEFSGSIEQVEGERLLLIATQKRQSCLNEISRLKTCGAQGENVSDGKGTLIISDIQLPLKREFMASVLEGRGTDTVHYFLCLIRHGAQVIVTQMVSTNDKVSDGALCFTNHIKLQNLPADFSVVFEVYALQTKKDILPHEKKYHIKRENSKIRLTPKVKKSDGKILMPAISSPGGPNAVRSPSFGVVGFTRFILQNCNKKIFSLEKVPFTSPLEGVLRARLQLHAEHNIAEKGFLTMFEDVSGFGAWHRRWCALDAHHLAYWKYPDDEHKKEPNGVIDLKQCVTGEVKLVSRDVCARPHTFQLVTVRQQTKGDKNTLISSSYNTITTTKHLLSADTKEERIHWCNKLNEALRNVRKWDPQALRPVESMQD